MPDLKTQIPKLSCTIPSHLVTSVLLFLFIQFREAILPSH